MMGVKYKNGFTVIELVIAIGIMVSLGLILMPNVSSYLKKAQTSKIKANIKSIHNSAETAQYLENELSVDKIIKYSNETNVLISEEAKENIYTVNRNNSTGLLTVSYLNSDGELYTFDGNVNNKLAGKGDSVSNEVINQKNVFNGFYGFRGISENTRAPIEAFSESYGANLLKGTDKLTEYFPYKMRREYVKTPYDFAPIFDKYGIDDKYSLSFELKSEVSGPVLVYMQNGSNQRYWFSENVNATTEFKKFSISISPRLHQPHIKESFLSFYGTYGSGRVPTARNVKLEHGDKATEWVSHWSETEEKETDINYLSSDSSITFTEKVDNGEYVEEIKVRNVGKKDIVVDFGELGRERIKPGKKKKISKQGYITKAKAEMTFYSTDKIKMYLSKPVMYK